MEKTIEIPEGYEARIEGGKVIFERKESEDERIREAIESIIRVYGKTQGEWIAGYDMDTLVVHLRDAFAYLERQKEQKTAEWSEAEKMHFANAILAAEKEWGVNSYTARFLEALRDNYKKCNSRWKPSEEQMKQLKCLPGLLRNFKLDTSAQMLGVLYEQLKKL